MAYTLIAFVFALLLLVTVHEYGHFLAARLCGVKVLRFSFGFGKVLAKFKDKKGTEFAFSLLPLGGYVKMLDEEEGDVTPDEAPLAFNNKSLWARMFVVIAGPLMNFVFAFFALWLVLVIGIKTLAPIVDKIIPGSAAQAAGFVSGEEIISFADKPVRSWRDVQFALLPLIGSDDLVPVVVRSLKNGQTRTLKFNMTGVTLDDNRGFLAKLGIEPFLPKIPLFIGEVSENSPASMSGLKAGDEIKSVNGAPLSDWFELVDTVRAHPESHLAVVILRHGKTMTLDVSTGLQMQKNGEKIGFIGVRPQQVEWPKQWLRYQRQGPFQAIGTALKQTYELTHITFSLIGRLFTGGLDLKNISGPVGIAQGAGESARSGISYYLSFLALISISLGVLNLLPIPMLDGGHLLYYLLEIVFRRPVPDAVKSIGMVLGIGLLLAITVLAFRNDIMRLMAH